MIIDLRVVWSFSKNLFQSHQNYDTQWKVVGLLFPLAIWSIEYFWFWNPVTQCAQKTLLGKNMGDRSVHYKSSTNSLKRPHNGCSRRDLFHFTDARTRFQYLQKQYYSFTSGHTVRKKGSIRLHVCWSVCLSVTQTAQMIFAWFWL